MGRTAATAKYRTIELLSLSGVDIQQPLLLQVEVSWPSV